MRKHDTGTGTGLPEQALPPLFAIVGYRASAGTQAEREVRRQYREAVEEQRRAAKKGSRCAQELLGLLCVVAPQIYGEAVERDLAEAYRWLWLAAAQGSLVARQALRRIEPNSATAERAVTEN